MARKKLTEAQRREREAEHARVMANVLRTRELAEKAQAKLDAEAREQAETARPAP